MRTYLLSILFCLLSIGSRADRYPFDKLVGDTPGANAFPLITAAQIPPLCLDKNDYKGVIRAANDLQMDMERVSGRKPLIYTDGEKMSGTSVIIGTLGKNKLIDLLAASGKLKTTDLNGKWESFVMAVVSNPFPGMEQALVIAGSDKRGTIYGIYELSRQLGVSPWYWWADVPVRKRSEAYFTRNYFASGEPAVRYRGIFLNDEIPCMTNWAKEKFGGMNSKMYAHVFELLLRLRANYLWPGMWGSFKEYNPGVPILKDEQGNYEGNSFNEDDPDNPRLADEYGIIMGTSHHEPMQRSQQEWLRNKAKYGNGEWNYMTNKKGIQKFFQEGIEHTKKYESLITVGMRGDDDKPMVDAGSAEANFKILEGIIKDQRKIISKVTGKAASETPQVWALYKEVMEYYDLGLKVPDDVIVLLCDDDWGDVRRLPDLNAERHPGGYGMYYHVGYYGAPRASKWLNNSQISHIWEQLQLTYDYGVDKIWILNVGDLKPCEYPMDFFLKMAWNPKVFNETNLSLYAQDFCAEAFGEAQSAEAADILDTYCQYSSRVTAEMLDEKTYSLETGEFKMVKDEFMALEARALRQFMELDTACRDSYRQLILFPVQAMANLYDLYYSVAMNRKLAHENDLKANDWADHAEYCFRRDARLCEDYNHKIADGKWNHLMDQVHIGYTRWHPPVRNIMPDIVRVQTDKARQGNCTFTSKQGVVVMEAEHYFECKNDSGSLWRIIPQLGRTLSGITLFPYNRKTEGAFLSYRMKLDAPTDSVKVYLIFDCTLPFKKGGHSVIVGFKDAPEKTININNELTWENNYTKMYPTAAARIIEASTILYLPRNGKEDYTLYVRPCDPGIVLQKIVVDCGGYEKTHLYMQETPYKKR